MLKTVGWIFGILIVVAIYALSGEIGKTLVRFSVASFQERREETILEKTMIEAAHDLNARTPMRVDARTTLVSVNAIDNRLRYTYLIHGDYSGREWANAQDEQKRRIIRFACNDPDMIFVLRNGGIYEYVYKNINILDILHLSVTNSDCEGSPGVLPAVHRWTDTERANFVERDVAECVRDPDVSPLQLFLIGDKSVEDYCTCKTTAKLEIILGDGTIEPPGNSDSFSVDIKEQIQQASSYCFGVTKER